MTTSERRSTTFVLVGIHDAGETQHSGTAGGAGGQLGLFDDTPEPAGMVWLAFTGDHDEADAARRFEARYGQPPRYIRDGLGGLLLAGPVPADLPEMLL